jgi:hypothetical protein
MIVRTAATVAMVFIVLGMLAACSPQVPALHDGRDSLRETTYKKPRLYGYRINYCYDTSSRGCGEYAASAFCSAFGFTGVGTWERESKVNNTFVMGTGKICESGKCDSFSKITCANVR